MQPPKAFVYEQPFPEVLPSLLAITRNMPTFFFIDPFGMKDLAIDALKPLLEQTERAPTEVLIRVDPVMLSRFAGWLGARERSDRARKTAASFKKLLTRLNIDTRDIEDGGGAVWVDKMDLFYRYVENFKHRFKYLQFVPIRPTYFAAPKYFLIHGTDSEHGAAFLNDTVSTTEDDLYANSLEDEQKRTGQLDMLGDLPRSPRYSLAELERAILAILSHDESMSLVYLRAELALTFGPEFREMHHKRMLRDLVKAKRIVQEPAGPLGDYSQLRRAKR